MQSPVRIMQKISEDNAKASETNAKTSEENARNSELAAKNSETIAVNASNLAQIAAEVAAQHGGFNSLKTSVSEGKALIATAVTGKGVQTAADATFQTMATNIGSIPTGYTSIASSSAEFTQYSNMDFTPRNLYIESCEMSGNVIIVTFMMRGRDTRSPLTRFKLTLTLT